MEVFDGGLSIDEVSVVLGIEDSPLDVFSRKGDNRIVAVPEADRKELCAVTVRSADQVCTSVAWRCFVLGDAGQRRVVGPLDLPTHATKVRPCDREVIERWVQGLSISVGWCHR